MTHPSPDLPPRTPIYRGDTYIGEAVDPLVVSVSRTIADNATLVQRWLANEPGSWGKLAGAGVLAYRRLLGRPLTDTERRQIWAALWEALQKQSRS